MLDPRSPRWTDQGEGGLQQRQARSEPAHILRYWRFGSLPSCLPGAASKGVEVAVPIFTSGRGERAQPDLSSRITEGQYPRLSDCQSPRFTEGLSSRLTEGLSSRFSEGLSSRFSEGLPSQFAEAEGSLPKGYDAGQRLTSDGLQVHS